MYETHKELFQGHLTILDQVRSYRAGVTDTLSNLVDKYEKLHGPNNLDRRARHTKNAKKKADRANELSMERSRGYLDAIKDVVSYLSKVNGTQQNELLKFAEWQEGELIRWEQIKEEVTGWDEEDYDE